MALREWLAIGVAGVFIHSRVKKNIDEPTFEDTPLVSFFRRIRENAELKRVEKAHVEIEKTREQEITELERRKTVNTIRRQMPCLFIGEPSVMIFEKLASDVANQFYRIKNISVRNAMVYVTVESKTGLSDWNFNVDFNNWGHIDGTYWVRSENDDSSIPEYYGKTLSSKICNYLDNRNIVVPNYSDVVDATLELGTSNCLNIHYHKTFLQKIFQRDIKCINIVHDSTCFCGEHIYPVIAMLRQAGFVNIKSVPIEDVDSKKQHYVYEVESVSIAGTTVFRYGYAFPYDSEVVILYHSKRKILMTLSERRFKRKNYKYVGDYLQELGFSEIYERKICDLVTGLITKNGSVENVFVDEGDEIPIMQGKLYYYDTKILICYHTFK